MQVSNKSLAIFLSLTLLFTVSVSPALATTDTDTGATTVDTGDTTVDTSGETTTVETGDTTVETSTGTTTVDTGDTTVETTTAETGDTSEDEEDDDDNNESNTEEVAETEEEINETADEIDETADDLTSEDETEVEEAIEEIEEDVANIEEELDDAEADGHNAKMHRDTIAKIKILMVRIKAAHKNKNKTQLVNLQKQLRNLLKSLKTKKIIKKRVIKLKAKAGVTKVKIKAKQVNIKDLKKQKLLSVRWGQVRKPETDTETKGETWDGELTVTNGKIKLVNPILFEDNDVIISADAEKIKFYSMIGGHFDGLLIKIFPDENGSYEDTTITVSFDNHEGLTYTKEDFQAGRYKENIDEDNRGVIIEKRLPGKIAGEVLENFREEHQDEIEDLLEDLDEEYQDDISGLLQELDEDEQADFVNKRKRHKTKLDKMMKHLPFVPQEKREELLEQKLAVLAEAENLDEAMEELNIPAEAKAMLEEVLALIEEYNFDAKTAVKVTARVQRFIKKAEEEGLSEEEIAAEIEKLRTETNSFRVQAKGQKFAQGIIPFKDTDDADWFTRYVSYVKDKSIVGGYKDLNGKELGEFRPGNNVTIGEVLKMALESAELGGDESGDPVNQNAVNHWSKKYFKKAEDLALSIVADTTVDPNKLATRGEVVRLAMEALGITPDDITETDFSDLPTSHIHAAYIQYATDAGVVSGDAGKDTFRPDDPINRAEVAKILQNMIVILKSAADVAE